MYDMSDACQRLAKHDSNLLFLGGDHFITYPLLKGLKRGRQARFGIVWFDAHADYYPDYGGYELSHATTLRRIVDGNLVRPDDVLGHDLRSAMPEQKTELAGNGKSQRHTIESFSRAVQKIADRTDIIYMSVDLDVLKPEIVPGVSHPESGGVDMFELVSFMRAAFSTGKVRYADVVELNPMIDVSGLTAITARDIVKELLTGFSMQKSLKQG